VDQPVKYLRDLFDTLSQFIPLLLTFVLAASSYWYATQSALESFGVQKDPKQVDYYLRNFSVQNHDLKVQRYSIVHSPFAQHIPETNLWLITTPNVQEYNANNGLLMAQADRGVYAVDQDKLRLLNNVHMQSKKQGQQTNLRTEELTLDNPNSLVTSAKPVQIERPGQQFQAKGIEFNHNTGLLKTLGAVQFTLEATR
jgi:LPS export ABC transporter protein LptC